VFLSVCLSVYVSVCLLDTIVNPRRTAEPVEVPFRIWTRVGHVNHLLGVGRDPSHGKKDTLGAYVGTPWLARGDVLDILNVILEVAR